MKLKLLIVLLVIQLGFSQQRTCGMQQEMLRIMDNPILKQEYLERQAKFQIELNKLIAEQVAAKNTNTTITPATLIRIPVAVHFPSAAAASAADKICLRALAQTQINILNADYNATNTDISNWNADSAFFPGVNVGNLNVQFELATQNHPAGTGLVNGVGAVTFGTDFLSNAAFDVTWSGYMNFVVRNLSGGELGNSPLGGSPASGQTVVIDNNAFASGGCTGYVPNSNYNLGRTVTHELGHFFNLDHTFAGCDGVDCAASGDSVCDTPPANTPQYTCVPAGSDISGCGGIQLTMNYMDYVYDSCMYMFTLGQQTRMLAYINTIFDQYRNNVLENNDFIVNNFSIFPIPNKGSFNIQFKDLTAGYSVEVIDMSGKVVYKNYFNDTSNLTQTVTIENTVKGVYFVTIKSNEVVVTKKIIIE